MSTGGKNRSLELLARGKLAFAKTLRRTLSGLCPGRVPLDICTNLCSAAGKSAESTLGLNASRWVGLGWVGRANLEWLTQPDIIFS